MYVCKYVCEEDLLLEWVRLSSRYCVADGVTGWQRLAIAVVGRLSTSTVYVCMYEWIFLQGQGVCVTCRPRLVGWSRRAPPWWCWRGSRLGGGEWRHNASAAPSEATHPSKKRRRECMYVCIGMANQVSMELKSKAQCNVSLYLTLCIYVFI